ncbi:MAG: hypothetical protein GY834_03965 [Bacteroidetes bacterium]|nr:hypothetical protein [Bacteroidota bacterium]
MNSIAVLFSVILAIFVLLRDPYIQSIATRIATEYFSRKLNAEIKIGELTVTAFFDILIKDIEVNDLHNNPILVSDKIIINIDKFRPRKNILLIDKIIFGDTDIQLKTYKGETEINFQFLIDNYTRESSHQVIDTIPPKAWKIGVNSLQLQNSNFSIINENKAKVLKGMDYNRIIVKEIDLKLSNLNIIGDTLSFRINELNCSENSGFMIHEFKGDFVLTETSLEAQSLNIKTNNSSLALDFNFGFSNITDFNDFVNKVNINTAIHNSQLNLSDIGYFAPKLFVMNNSILIDASIKGTVSDFVANSLLFNFGNHTSFNGRLSMKGLPDIKETFVNLKIEELHTSTYDISEFGLPIHSTYLSLPSEISRLGRVSMIGHINGVYKDFETILVVKSEIGNLSLEANMSPNNSTGLTQYNGRIQSLKFDLGAMLNSAEYLGSMNLDLDFNGSGLSQEDVLLNINGIISSLELKQNTYSQVKVNAELADNKFDGHLAITDEDIGFTFDGRVDFNKEIPEFDFNSSIKNAHLYNINLFDQDSTAILSTDLNMKFAGVELDDMEGSIKINNTVYLHENKEYLLEELTLKTSYDSLSNKLIKVKSDYIDAEISGKFLFKELISSVKSLVGKYAPILISDEVLRDTSLNIHNLNYKIELKNTLSITDLIYPNLEIAPNTLITGKYNSANNSVYLEANSNEISFNGMNFHDWYLKTDNTEESFLILTGCKDLVFDKASKADHPLGFENLNLVASVQNDSVDYRIVWDDFKESNENTGYLSGYVKLNSKTLTDIGFKKADFMINNTAWNINLLSKVTIDSSEITIDNLSIFNENQEFSVDGKVSGFPEDSLHIKFKDWDFANFDLLINNSGLDIDGVLNGDINLSDVFKDVRVVSDLQISDLSLNKENLGRGEIKTIWSNIENSLFASFEIINIGNVSESKVFGISGLYYPTLETNNLDFDIAINNFNLTYLSPFVSEFLSNIEGLASGDIKLDGSVNKPKLIGELSLMRASVKVDYLNVAYSLANKVNFKENEIRFDQIVLYDSLGNQANCSGRIAHDYFSNLNFDINISPQNLLGLNTTREQNSLFFGQAKATGDVHIHGPIDNIVMDITLTSEKGTKINIPIDYDLEVTETDYIIFVNSSDTVQAPPDYNVDLSGLTLNLNLSVTPDAGIEIFLPYQIGNIKADGNGEMKLTVNSKGDFEIFGDYFIQEGTFLLTLQNLLNKRFSILEGGKISWTGSPYDAKIDIKTLYKTKASLADFEASLTGSNITGDRRYNIDCFLELQQQLFNPEIHFSIGIPNIDSNDEQLILSQLDTDNDAQMNQQMISLLVLGSFSVSSGSTPSAGAIGASSINVVSNQVSNWLSKISKDFDVGINYRPSGEYTQEELEMALSMQLFDNRVLVDYQYSQALGNQANNTTNIVGDVNIEVKLTDDGRFRIKAFNRSNINSFGNTYEDRAPNTQGVGVFYRKEFDTFGDLFKKRTKKMPPPLL